MIFSGAEEGRKQPPEIVLQFVIGRYITVWHANNWHGGQFLACTAQPACPLCRPGVIVNKSAVSANSDKSAAAGDEMMHKIVKRFAVFNIFSIFYTFQERPARRRLQQTLLAHISTGTEKFQSLGTFGIF